MSAPPPPRLALVTGGCRRIGAAIAARLAQDGYALALHAGHDVAPEPALAGAIAAAGAPWRVFAADFADGAAVAGLMPRVIDHFGRAPDLLINNAARFEWDSPETVSLPAMLAHHAVNCAAPAVLIRALAESASAARPATAVNILDQRVAQPHSDQLSYTLSKLALAELTMILARHYAPAVRVVAVAPGLTVPTAEYGAEQMARLAQAMPLDRLATPADIADAVAYLVGARAVTGQTIFVDGGAHLCRYERDFLFLESGFTPTA